LCALFINSGICVDLLVSDWYASAMKNSSVRTRSGWEVMTRADAQRRGLPMKPLAPLYRATDLVTVLDQSLWYETRIFPRWRVALRLANQQGQPIISEARIFPDEDKSFPVGRWSGEYGASAKVPPGGLTARVLRTVRTQAFRRDLRTITERWKTMLRKLEPNARRTELLQGLEPELRTAIQSPEQPMTTRGRKGRSDRELARIATIYEAAYLAGRPAIAAVAKAATLSESKARDAVRRARVRGLLSPATKQGKGGGVLTPTARALLHQPKAKKLKSQQTEGRPRHGKKR
jgi:hypothetical protein